MLREPAATTDRPLCFGVSHDPAEPDCAVCPYREDCGKKSVHWTRFRSLAVQAQQAEDDLFKIDERRLPDVYMRLFRLHIRKFGTDKLARYVSDPNGRAWHWLATAYARCVRDGIDFRLWVEANMLQWKRQGARGKYGFQPYFLLGERAAGRYNAFIRRSFRRNRNTRAEVRNSLRRSVDARIEVETEAGSYYVATRLMGERIKYEDALRSTDAPEDHVDALGRDHAERCVRLHAALNVTLSHNVGLASRVSAPPEVDDPDEFWLGLAKVIRQCAPTVEMEQLDLSDIDGTHWGQDRA